MIILIRDKNTRGVSNLAKTRELGIFQPSFALTAPTGRTPWPAFRRSCVTQKPGTGGGQVSRYTTNDGKRNNKKPMQEMN